jgi:ABC-2 type transport system permease protein/lipopolysaccharide transport system permease protein
MDHSAIEPPGEPPAELHFRRRLSVGTAARELWNARELVRTLAERDLRARYKQAYLGFAWAVILGADLVLGVFVH